MCPERRKCLITHDSLGRSWWRKTGVLGGEGGRGEAAEGTTPVTPGGAESVPGVSQTHLRMAKATRGCRAGLGLTGDELQEPPEPAPVTVRVTREANRSVGAVKESQEGRHQGRAREQLGQVRPGHSPGPASRAQATWCAAQNLDPSTPNPLPPEPSEREALKLDVSRLGSLGCAVHLSCARLLHPPGAPHHPHLKPCWMTPALPRPLSLGHPLLYCLSLNPAALGTSRKRNHVAFVGLCLAYSV